MAKTKVYSFEPTKCHIGTFNCKNLTITNIIKIKEIANIIRQSNIEIVAIQEINNLDALKLIIDELGSEYNEIHCNTAIDFSRIHEYIGFIYKIDRISAISCITFPQSEKQKYIGSSGKLMIRAPVYARFIIENKTDIVLISYHTNQGNPMYDCMWIKECIQAIRMKNTCNNVIVLGDFNTSCSDDFAFEKIIKDKWKSALIYTINTNYANTNQYDNIWYEEKSCEQDGEPRVWREEMVEDISDHCLCSSKFNIYGGMSANSQFLKDPDLTLAFNYKKNIINLCSIQCFGKFNCVSNCIEI